MRWFVAALLALGMTGMPLLTDTTVKADKVVVFVQYEANSANRDVTIAVTALDSTPPEWAYATVYHVWWIDADAGHFNDKWPDMRTGHYRVKATLHRLNQPDISAPAVDVEVR